MTMCPCLQEEVYLTFTLGRGTVDSLFDRVKYRLPFRKEKIELFPCWKGKILIYPQEPVLWQIAECLQ
jgi:hypothetical protein